MKKLFYIILFCLTSSYVFGQENIQSYDCNLIGGNAINSGEIINQPEVDVAIKLLKSYCIESRQLQKSQDFEPIENPTQSPMFLDQCVSVGFRKLDANKNLLYPGMSVSETGANWQKFLAQETKRIDPSGRDNIFNQFINVWGIDKPDGYRWNYYKVCNECLYTYKGMVRAQYSHIDDTFNKKCNELADKRILQEQDFVESFTNQKLNFNITNSVDNYLNTYIAQQRMPTLLDKLNSVFSTFNIIGQKMGPGTQSCNY